MSSGKRNGNWKGGRSIASNGYVLLRVGKDHHLADVRGYAYEHRVVAEKKLGRRLRDGEVVHHRDGDQRNNDPDNLEVVASHAHHAVHHRAEESRLRLPDEPNPTVACECGCGERFARYDETGRPRSYVSGHNPMSSPTMDAVLRALRDGPAHRREIMDAIGRPGHAVAVALSKLRRRGEVDTDGRGTWHLVDGSGEAA